MLERKNWPERDVICGVYNAANDILALLRNPGIKYDDAVRSMREKARAIDNILGRAMERAKAEAQDGTGQQS